MASARSAQVSKRVQQEVRTVCSGLSLKKVPPALVEIGSVDDLLSIVQFRITMVALRPLTCTAPETVSAFIWEPRSLKTHESKSAVLSQIRTAGESLLPRRLLNTESAY